MRLNYDDDDKVEVQMSPLIDCVFLLLIFFLVTTMMKKWEMQIPLTLPTMTSSLSTTRAGEEAVIIAVDEKKNVYQVAIVILLVSSSISSLSMCMIISPFISDVFPKSPATPQAASPSGTPHSPDLWREVFGCPCR